MVLPRAIPVWLENDGDGADQETAAARDGFNYREGAIFIDITGQRISALRGRGAETRLPEVCATSALVIAANEVAPPIGCVVYDLARLRETGSLAIWPSEDGLRIVTAAELSGRRLWSLSGR